MVKKAALDVTKERSAAPARRAPGERTGARSMG
jgi:hypothetical protein